MSGRRWAPESQWLGGSALTCAKLCYKLRKHLQLVTTRSSPQSVGVAAAYAAVARISPGGGLRVQRSSLIRSRR